MGSDELTAVIGVVVAVFFVNVALRPEIYTLSLHDALPILPVCWISTRHACTSRRWIDCHVRHWLDRKSTRLNSSHTVISYAVFCLKKKTTPSRCRPRRRAR